MTFNLNQRQERVLRATVRHYIVTAEPVGSKALVDEYRLDVSPATIRNAMGYLEKAGLLYQPHTSAGRVPSDSGYRVYVDRYLDPPSGLTQQVTQRLHEHLQGHLHNSLGFGSEPTHPNSGPPLGNRLEHRLDNHELDRLLQQTAQLLASLSGCIAMIAPPQPPETHIRYVRLLPVEGDRIMALVVTEGYQTHSTSVPLPVLPDDPWPEEEAISRQLTLLSNFLEGQLRDRSLAELAALDWQELGREFDLYGDLLRDVLASLARRSQAPASTRILIGGMAQVLCQPEFTELQQVQALIRLLEEEQTALWHLIAEEPATSCPTATGSRPIRVRIGGENAWEPLQAYTLISSTYGTSKTGVGRLGILGPTRLDYGRAIAAVEATADYLSEAIA